MVQGTFQPTKYFGGHNFRRKKVFGGQNFPQQAKFSALLSAEILSDKVIIILMFVLAGACKVGEITDGQGDTSEFSIDILKNRFQSITKSSPYFLSQFFAHRASPCIFV